MYTAWLVKNGNAIVLVGGFTITRDGAKRRAYAWLGGNQEDYIVTPLTNPGDRVHLDITVHV